MVGTVGIVGIVGMLMFDVDVFAQLQYQSIFVKWNLSISVH